MKRRGHSRTFFPRRLTAPRAAARVCAPRLKTERPARARAAGRRLAPALAAPFLLFCAAVAYAVTTFLVVSPTNLQGWQIQRSTSGVVPTPTPTPDVLFVTGPATPPLGTGSAEFRVGPDGGGAAQLRHPGFAGTRLPNPSATATPAANELTSLSYSTYTQQDGSGGQSPYIILQIDTDGDAGIEDLLFFDPVYQSATFCPSNPQASLVTGQWQTWDAFNGCWYSVFGTNGSGPGTNTQPLRTLSAAPTLANAVIANSSPSGLGGVRLVTGFGAGAWDNYVGNADAFRIGVGTNDTVYNFDPNQSTPAAAGAFIITEFRTRGPVGTGDEFVEIYNNSNSEHVVAPPDGSSGYGVATGDGQLRCTLPFGTVIPARGHFLCAGSAYSLSAYAAQDAVITGDIPDQPGLALFSTTNPANFNTGTRLDAVGHTTAPALYREGAGLAALPAADIEYAAYRSLAGGPPRDTGDNAADFVLVDTDPATTGSGLRLGAPGPQNLASPVQLNDRIKASLFDPGAGSHNAPNTERSATVVTNGQLGTLIIRRRFRNNTAENVTGLRFRVVDITTLNSPAVGSPQADLRALSSSDEAAVATSMGPESTRGLTLDAPPTQPLGGGWNSSLSVNDVSSATPLAPGQSVNVNISLGVQQAGVYRFFINIEAAPAPAPTTAPARDHPRASKDGVNKGSAARRK